MMAEMRSLLYELALYAPFCPFSILHFLFFSGLTTWTLLMGEASRLVDTVVDRKGRTPL